MQETPDARLKRMKMRSWRRGTKEMDMILGPFADEHLVGMDEARLTLYDRLLWENDQEILPWILGNSESPNDYKGLISEIGVFARSRLKK
ncbi:FAD assembly factor SdhE [Pseudorhodobacter aquimaris]|uniref:FAD assembly factor SdhE n=1 Tax=Pseudorhodobacter aquimaris TaxID=687412 RepID=UPI00067DAFBA|nr:succinate dehydrogenase assembly factor 2 [Pseudorhodobacter aquimaris]